MTLIRWNPLIPSSPRGLFHAPEDLNRLFDRHFVRGLTPSEAAASFVPPVDVEETADAYVLKADLPGLTQQDVKLVLVGDTLTLRGERKVESRSNDASSHRMERRHGSFERSFEFTTPVQNDQVRASFKDGVLEVRVPKAEQARQREIEIAVG